MALKESKDSVGASAELAVGFREGIRGSKILESYLHKLLSMRIKKRLGLSWALLVRFESSDCGPGLCLGKKVRA